MPKFPVSTVSNVSTVSRSDLGTRKNTLPLGRLRTVRSCLHDVMLSPLQVYYGVYSATPFKAEEGLVRYWLFKALPEALLYWSRLRFVCLGVMIG